jgi:hypothetical protein
MGVATKVNSTLRGVSLCEVTMFVSENSRKSRPKVLYGILAKSALAQLDQHNDDVDEAAYFQNLVRLLDLYGSNSLHRPTPKAVLDRRPIDVRSIQRNKADADAVENALSRAHTQVLPKLDKDEVVGRLRNIFLRICTQDSGRISAADLNLAKKFLKALVSELKQ